MMIIGTSGGRWGASGGVAEGAMAGARRRPLRAFCRLALDTVHPPAHTTYHIANNAVQRARVNKINI